jgi:hypothetical protein
VHLSYEVAVMKTHVNETRELDSYYDLEKEVQRFMTSVRMQLLSGFAPLETNHPICTYSIVICQPEKESGSLSSRHESSSHVSTEICIFKHLQGWLKLLTIKKDILHGEAQ